MVEFAYAYFHLSERFRIGTPRQVLNGIFGLTAAPVFLDNFACDGVERTLLDCPRGSRLGLISESCACTTFEDCVEDLGVICPGLLNTYIVIHNFFMYLFMRLLHSSILAFLIKIAKVQFLTSYMSFHRSE